MNYSIITQKGYKNDELEQYYKMQYYLPEDQCIEIYNAESISDIKRRMGGFASQSDFLVLLGGKDAFLETVKGMLLSEKMVPIMPIPEKGTDFAKSMRYLRDLKSYVEQARGNVQNQDVFTFNQDVFCFEAIPKEFEFRFFTKIL